MVEMASLEQVGITQTPYAAQQWRIRTSRQKAADMRPHAACQVNNILAHFETFIPFWELS
jgi:hypothetical protein